MRSAMAPERLALPMAPAVLRRANAYRIPGDCGVNESGILPGAFSDCLQLLIAHCGEVDAVRGVLGWGL